MAAIFRRCLLRRMQAIHPLPRSSLAFSIADRMFSWNCMLRNSRIKSGWSFEYFVQHYIVSHVRMVHSSAGLLRKSKNVDTKQVELVNILSPGGALIAEGEPLIYLERFCGYFASHTYEEVISKETSDSKNVRSFKIVPKTGEEQAASSKKKEKGRRNVKMASSLDMKTLKKLQAVLVEDGEVQLIIKARSDKKDAAKTIFNIEQHVKQEMNTFCSFSLIGNEPGCSSFKLTLKTKNDQFYKNLFNIVYRREKEEVDLILDLMNTVKTFSDESESK